MNTCTCKSEINKLRNELTWKYEGYWSHNRVKDAYQQRQDHVVGWFPPNIATIKNIFPDENGIFCDQHIFCCGHKHISVVSGKRLGMWRHLSSLILFNFYHLKAWKIHVHSKTDCSVLFISINNFSVMSGHSHLSLGINLYFNPIPVGFSLTSPVLLLLLLCTV